MIPLIDSTTIETNFRITSSAFVPKDLIRSADAANVIASVSTTEITLTTPITDGLILPTQFTTSGTLPVTEPQILVEQVYFIKTTSSTTAIIYQTSEDAKADRNAFTISGAGTGTNNAVTLNSWALSNVVFSKYPVFDFSDPGSYDAVTFTPAMISGYNIAITATAGTPFLPGDVGGAFEGNGGICRIISFTNTALINVDILQPFASTAGIPGTEAFLAEPAWSTARGWPSKCSSFQNRAIFANTRSLPNALFLSVTNDYSSFDGLEGDDDSAIFWYPSSDNVNVIRFIVPYRSLTVHTNTGIYSTPLTFEQAITPSTFSMTLQDSTPATVVQPRALDNQVIVISGNDVHTMLWDGFNNAYTSNIASIANEQLIRSPIDEASYIDLNRAGSRYMFIINANGGLVIYQTLISENVSGFTPSTLTQTYGQSYFRWTASSANGRAWFMTEREIADAGIGDLVAGFTTDTLVMTTPSTFALGAITAFKIAATTSLPTSTPQLVAGTYYWAVASDTTSIAVYTAYADAVLGEGSVTFTNAGVGATITPWPLVTNFYLEELSFEIFTDCTFTYTGVAQDTFTGLSRFNAQMVKANGDGFGFTEEGSDGEVTLTSHGQPVAVTEASIGFPITTVMEPLNVAVPGVQGYKGSSLTLPTHIRAVNLMFNDTIGGEVNGTPIQLNTLVETIPGVPPVKTSGVMEMTPMLGWDDGNSAIVITHDDPFDIKLIGIFYRIET
jgi:hypothetical protein